MTKKEKRAAYDKQYYAANKEKKAANYARFWNGDKS